MTTLFWLDSAAYAISALLATALALIVLGTAPRRAQNRIFALFALAEAVWAICSLLLRMTLWLQISGSHFFLELATVCFALMGPFLLMFTTRYLGRHSRYWDLAAILGVAATAILSIPLFQHQIVLSPYLSENGSALYDVSAWGFGAALVPTLFLATSVMLFWRERRQSGQWYLFVSTLVLLAGFLGGGLFNPPLPVMSLTTTFNVAVLGYVIITQQLLNPLRDLTAELERKVEQRTQELQRAYDEVETRVLDRTAELRRRNRELATLYETVTMINSDLSLQIVLQRIAEQMAHALESTACGLSLWERERNLTEILVDYHISKPEKIEPPGTIYKLDEYPATRRVLETRTPLVVQYDDPAADPAELAYLQSNDMYTLLMLPMCARDEVVGLIEISDDRKRRGYTEEDMRLAEGLAAQAAIAIRNAQLYENAQARSRYLETLQRISATLRSTLPLYTVLETLVSSAGETLRYIGTLIAIPDAAGERLVLGAVWGGRFLNVASRFTGFGLDALSLPLTAEENPVARAYLAGALETVGEPEAIIMGVEPQIPAGLAAPIAKALGAHLAACVPLPAGEEIVGVLVAVSTRAELADEERAMLLGLADQAGLAIRHTRLYDEARRRADRLAVVNHVARAVGTTLQLDELIETVYQQITPIFQPDAFFLALYDAEANELDFRLQVDEGIRLSPERQSGDTGLTSVIVATKKPLLIRNLKQEQNRLPVPVFWGTHKSPLSWLGVPMQIAEQMIGVLCVQSYQAHAYDEEDQLLLSTIAEQVAVAVEQARLYQTLHDSEERYRTLFEEANDAVFLETMDGQILEVNERACQLLGYEREELLRLTLGEIVPPEVRAMLPQIFQILAEKGGLRMETEHVHRDGSRLAVEMSLTCLEVGGEDLVLAFVRDIRERRRMEERLRSAQKMEAIGTLAGGVAHDFNNILTGVLGYASLVQQELPPGSSLHTDMETIIHSAERGMDLTRQLLALARYRQQVEKQAVDLNAIVREVTRLLQRTIDRAIAIQLDLHEELQAVEGDAGQLHQMVLNLCLNARDAMPDGGQLIVSTRGERMTEEEARSHRDLAPGGYVVLSVTDTGEGMEAAVRERIFEPFFTTKEHGRGLGLAMVYGTVRGHGGAITVNSEPGQGTTVTVYLPAHAAPAPAPRELRHPILGGNETVLVVDDEETVRSFLQRGLQRAGYIVLLAQDGLEAVEIYRRQGGEIDLVVLDMIMPRLGGRETYQQLLEINPQAKVLLSSGYSEDSQSIGIPETDRQGFLQKPYDLEAVQRKVREMLDGP